MNIAVNTKSKSSKVKKRQGSNRVSRPITHKVQVQEKLRLYGFEVDIKIKEDQEKDKRNI